MNQLRAGLPPMPPKMSALPIDEKGYPVPFFVAWVDGKPDHRVVDSAKMPVALRGNLCWLCGQKLGAFKAFVIGPMCSITRSISEPPSHLECARYAAVSCPLMTRPRAKRREANLPDDIVQPAGEGLRRNPGAVCVWSTKTFKPFRVGNGVLFEIGAPESTEWYAEGRPATREEIDESVRTGLPSIEKMAQEEDAQPPRRSLLLPYGMRAHKARPTAMQDLERRKAELTAMLDKQFGAAMELPHEHMG